MEAPLTRAVLKAKQRELRGGFPETMGLRVHRAISWIGRAEAAGDDDARFLFLWIGFNAAYADEEEVQNAAAPERDAFKEFFERVVRLDAGQRIYDAIWDNFSGPIRVLLHNKYVFTPFWKHHNGVEGFENWEGNCSPGGSTGYSLSWLRQSTGFPCRAMVVATKGLYPSAATLSANMPETPAPRGISVGRGGENR